MSTSEGIGQQSNGKTKYVRIALIYSLSICFRILFSASPALAFDINLTWDENTEQSVAGYNIYMRQEGQAYNDNDPVGSGSETTCPITGLLEDTAYYFIVRAHDTTGTESDDSDEVRCYRSSTSDDLIEANEDGIDDTSDPDDDNDGMPDTWEIEFGLNPLVDDADEDLDGDGLTNGEEYSAGSDPTRWNSLPNQPLLLAPVDDAVDIALTPTLRSDQFFDPDQEDSHSKTEWQISEYSDFTSTVFQLVSTSALEALSVPELILKKDQIYYWRVRHYDCQNEPSEWSEPFRFDTIVFTADDLNSDGIPDTLEIGKMTDLDRDGIFDSDQTDIKVMNTLLGEAQVGIKVSEQYGMVETIQSVNPDAIMDMENKPSEILMDLIGFRLAVDKGATVEVAIYFSEGLPDDAKWYKYDLIKGWQDFSEHADFIQQDDGTTMVILELQDGGFGDADGSVNGIIIDPSGPVIQQGANRTTIASAIVADEDGAGGCFIAASEVDVAFLRTVVVLTLLLIFFSVQGLRKSLKA